MECLETDLNLSVAHSKKCRRCHQPQLTSGTTKAEADLIKCSKVVRGILSRCYYNVRELCYPRLLFY